MHIKLYLTLFILSVLTITWGQACSTGKFSSTEVFSTKLYGNGNTYEGKGRILHHYVSGFTCEGRPQPESILIRKNETDWVLIQNTAEKCAAVDQVPISGVIYDDVSKQATLNGNTFVSPQPYFVIEHGILQFEIQQSLIMAQELVPRNVGIASSKM